MSPLLATHAHKINRIQIKNNIIGIHILCYLVGQIDWTDFVLLRSLRSSALPTGILKVCLSLVVFLLKFTFFVSYIENLSFGHSVAFFSLCDAVARSLKSNLRPSLKISPPDIFFASGSFSLVQIPTPIPNKKTTSNGGFFCLVGVTGFEPATSTSRT